MADEQATADQPVSATEFAAAIKAKYPVYASVPDAELTQKMLEKYPEYRSRVRLEPTAPPEAAKPGGLGAFVGEVGEAINPINLVKVAGGAIPGAPFGGPGTIGTIKAIGAAQGALYDKAKAAYDQGDYVTAARHFVEYLVPFVGPAHNQAVEALQKGETAAGLGKSVGLGLSLFGPGAVTDATAARYPLAARVSGPPSSRPVFTPPSRLTPQEAASNVFAEEQGIPLEAATATGSPVALAIQKRVANSMGGEGTASRAIRAQAEGLTRAGGALAEETHPTPVSGVTAGEELRGSIEKLITDLHQEATTAYDKLRALEQDPEQLTRVPKQEHASITRDITARQQASLGQVPTEGQLTELRRIHAELEALPYVKRTWTEAPRKSGNAGDYDIVAGAGGAPVFHDIVNAAGVSGLTRGDVQRAIESALESGHYNSAAKGAFEVAQGRLAGDSTLSKPSLPPEAGVLATGRTEAMPLAVNVGAVKPRLRPIYTALMRERELTPLMGDKGRALVALDRLMNGPDYAPLSVVDAALGDLKGLSRVKPGQLPAMRTPGQGIAATAVQELDRLVQQAARDAGPEVLQALREGRASTRGKYEVAEVLESLREEPAQLVRQLTRPRDENVALLRRVAQVAPGEVQKVARAYLQDLLDTATERGRFEHTDKLYAEWQKLGAQTKAMLFPQAGQRAALDNFFLLAKRIGQNPNPSGTAHTLTALNFGSIPPMWALAKLLYTPKGVAALSRLLAVQPRVGGVPLPSGLRTVQAAALADVVKAARDTGVPLQLPAAAQSTNPGSTR